MIMCAKTVVILLTSDKVSRARPKYKVRSTSNLRFHRLPIAFVEAQN